jgi:Skp family chaperone for outer membrane proteins
MELRVVDFDILTRSFQPYVDGIMNIESEKRKMLDSVEPARKEMQSIISRQTSGLIMDESSQKRDAEKFRQLQDSLMKSDVEFKKKLREMQEDLNSEVYSQLSEIISVWSKENSIHLVMGKMEIVYNTDELDVTEQILHIIKEKGLFFTPEESLSGQKVEPQTTQN